MLLLCKRPPLLETPGLVFNQDVFTRNGPIFPPPWVPTGFGGPSTATSASRCRGSLEQQMCEFEPMQVDAVNQCSGNSRGLSRPRDHGAMGNALRLGVRLQDVHARARVNARAVQVSFNGLDSSLPPGTPDFLNSLNVNHTRDGEVIVAYGMNGQPG